MNPKRFSWWKLVAVWALFLVLHFSYETFPNMLFKLIGEEGETTFFHMKMLFFAYLLVSIVEFVARRKTLVSTSSFASSRALVSVAYPWLTITIWFFAEAVGLTMHNLAVELVYANLATLLGIYMALLMEEFLGGLDFRPSAKAMIALVFACALLSYTAFSFTTPQPFFTTPPGF
ncbi:MAG: DUF6512 family protein [Coriobacteriia bacterium]|nr:DUF6512 family protein [Coriobacteriia bacterium]